MKNQLNTYNVTPGSTINLLVRSAAGNPPPASAQYSLGVHNPGSAESVTGFKAWNNENLTKLLVQSGRPDEVMDELKTASIEAHDRISFSGTVKDSDNNPVPLTSVRVDVWANGSGVLEPQTLLADENGYFNGSVSLKGDECSAIETFNVHNRVHSGTPTNPSEWWDISYGVGRYIVSLPNATTVSENYFIHICQEKLTKMCYYERDYNTGGSKWTCL